MTAIRCKAIFKGLVARTEWSAHRLYLVLKRLYIPNRSDHFLHQPINHCCSVPKTWRDRWDRRVSLKPLTAEWCDRTSMGQADSTEGTWLPCDNTALVLVLLAMCEVCKRTSELSCLSVSYCYLHSFTFRKSDLVLNIMLTLCVVWLRLGLPEAASSAISCPVSADLGYRYVDICVCPTMF